MIDSPVATVAAIGAAEFKELQASERQRTITATPGGNENLNLINEVHK
jgi:hypothetical protein